MDGEYKNSVIFTFQVCANFIKIVLDEIRRKKCLKLYPSNLLTFKFLFVYGFPIAQF